MVELQGRWNALVCYLFAVSVETLGEAWQLRWSLTARCAFAPATG
jgi:hypothetical protein